MTKTNSLASAGIDRVFTVADGHVISYSVVGPEDGFPVIFMQGLSGHRLIPMVFSEMLAKHNLKLISPDRPGNGLSDEFTEEERRPLNWPTIISQLVNVLSIDKFGLIAQSFGAIFALAIALECSDKIVGPIQLISPWITLSEPTTNSTLRTIRNLPNCMLKTSLMAMSCAPKVALALGSINMLTNGWSDKEKKIYTPSVANIYQEILEISTKEKSSYAVDVIACLEKHYSFGFAYSDIYYPVNIYHGDKDTLVPLEAVKHTQSTMTTATLYVQPEGTHSLIFDLEVLDMVFANIRSAFSISTE
ncbi:hypothetical protein K7432_008254 [Basidiobolus ranarum]|uniref:AB hydrolase-1 domain-containing protein n=1 Tax=Basidiobolus ranarum TaxID=34480 RepID=A0ABR2VYW6_9FUNG